MKKYNDIEQYAQIYKDTFVNESSFNEKRFKAISQEVKDKALIDIINIIYDGMTHGTDSDEIISYISRVIEDNELDPSRF